MTLYVNFVFSLRPNEKKERIRNKENERQETQPVSFFFFFSNILRMPEVIAQADTARSACLTANVFFFLVSFITRIIFSPRS